MIPKIKIAKQIQLDDLAVYDRYDDATFLTGHFSVTTEQHFDFSLVDLNGKNTILNKNFIIAFKSAVGIEVVKTNLYALKPRLAISTYYSRTELMRYENYYLIDLTDHDNAWLSVLNFVAATKLLKPEISLFSRLKTAATLYDDYLDELKKLIYKTLQQDIDFWASYLSIKQSDWDWTVCFRHYHNMSYSQTTQLTQYFKDVFSKIFNGNVKSITIEKLPTNTKLTVEIEINGD